MAPSWMAHQALTEAIAFVDKQTEVKRRPSRQEVKDARFDEVWKQALGKLGHRANQHDIAVEVQRVLAEQDNTHIEVISILERANSREWPDSVEG
jgi:hypothetical protein